GPAPLALALGADRAAVLLGEELDEGEAEPEAAVLAREGGVRLAEPIEDVGEEARGDAPAGVADHDLDAGAVAAAARLHASPLRRELDRVRQEVGDDLLEPAGI